MSIIGPEPEEVGDSQPADSDLAAIAALSTTPYGRSLLELANQSALATPLAADPAFINGFAPRTASIIADTGTTYTPVLTDAGDIVTLSDAAATTLTLPRDSDVAFPVGTVITFVQIGAGQVTATAGTGVTLRSPGPTNKFRAQWSSVSAMKIAADTWLIAGDLAAT